MSSSLADYKGAEHMVTNHQILQKPPQGGSPLGSLVKGDITRKEYQQQVQEKWAREDRLSDAARQTPRPPEPETR
jgi:hypothetical protein